jgi:hypothetical protein
MTAVATTSSTKVKPGDPRRKKRKGDRESEDLMIGGYGELRTCLSWLVSELREMADQKALGQNALNSPYPQITTSPIASAFHFTVTLPDTIWTGID